MVLKFTSTTPFLAALASPLTIYSNTRRRRKNKSTKLLQNNMTMTSSFTITGALPCNNLVGKEYTRIG